MPIETTEEHFNIFKEEFLKWQNKLGLTEWRVDFAHANSENHYSHLHYRDVSGRFVGANLSKQWPSKEEDEFAREVNEEWMRFCGKHEALHLLNIELYMLALARFSSKDRIDAAEESIVRRLEKIL
jgi:hypothetical protein